MSSAYPRIVSLLPSATEIAVAVGAGDRIAGISHECDYPESIRDRPALTSSRVDTGGSSPEIDARVRDVTREALSMYAIDGDLLGQLAPDVILTQALCEVCAVSLDDVRAAAARLAHRGVALVSLEPTRLSDVWGDVTRVADAAGLPEEGRAARAALEKRVARVTERARAGGERPRVVSIEWLDPVMLGGLWMPDVIEAAGGVAVGALPGGPAPTVSLEELAALVPDVVLVKPCGFSLARTRRELELVRRIASAVPGARVYLTDGSAYFNRPGPRLADSVEILAACAHPERFADLRERHAGAIEPLGAGADRQARV